ncbi:hypothetical protein [Streptomyces sp. NBC_00519]|uniref:hypothetical protein n=1 Tax=Streptomyces sp. NBC_00519 TaxID=2975764 RepID=UPI0030E4C1D9
MIERREETGAGFGNGVAPERPVVAAGEQVGQGRQLGGRHRLRLHLVQEVQGIGGVAAGAA